MHTDAGQASDSSNPASQHLLATKTAAFAQRTLTHIGDRHGFDIYRRDGRMLAVLYLRDTCWRARSRSRDSRQAPAPTFSILGLTLLGVMAYELINPCPAPALAGALIALCLAVYLILPDRQKRYGEGMRSLLLRQQRCLQRPREPDAFHQLIPIPADARI